MREIWSSAKPMVTIGMCVKNCGTTVRNSIRSVIQQSLPHHLIELIIVDGCSKDNTLGTIIDDLKNTDIKAKVFSENEGLGKARQIVVDKAEGDYIVWVDGDMVLTKDFVRKQVEYMERHREVGIAKGKYGASPMSKSIVAALENVEFVLNTMVEGETSSKSLGASGCIYRAKAIREVGGFDSQISGVGEDMYAEAKIRKSGWHLHITSALFFEIRRQTWRTLWAEYFWHGKGGRRIFEKDRRLISTYKMLPPIALATELLRAVTAYNITSQKVMILLPFHYIFKRVAWLLGFFSGR